MSSLKSISPCTVEVSLYRKLLVAIDIELSFEDENDVGESAGRSEVKLVGNIPKASRIPPILSYFLWLRVSQ